MCAEREMTEPEQQRRDEWMPWFTSMVSATVDLHQRLQCETMTPRWKKELAHMLQYQLVAYAARMLAMQVAIGNPPSKEPHPPPSIK